MAENNETNVQNVEPKTNQNDKKDVKRSSTTICKTLIRLQGNKILIPEMQRKFTWTPERIEKLFDSIMRDYPINTFMFWNINDSEVKRDSKFYEFIHHFVRGTLEDNPDHPTHLNHEDFWAVIDGQQRLTALLIGLCGTYTFKKGTKDKNTNEPRSLYLLLKEKSKKSEQNDTQNDEQNQEDESDQEIDPNTNAIYENDKKEYNFQFYTKEEVASKKDGVWFKVGDILNIYDSLKEEKKNPAPQELEEEKNPTPKKLE